MRTCGIAIIGLGLMGSSALLCAGAPRLPMCSGSIRCRPGDSAGLFARLLPGLPPLQFRERGLHRAQRPRLCGMAGAGVRRADKPFCSRALFSKPVRPGRELVAASRAAAACRERSAHQRAAPTAREANAAFPAFNLPDGLGRRRAGKRRYPDGRSGDPRVPRRRCRRRIIRAAARMHADAGRHPHRRPLTRR